MKQVGVRGLKNRATQIVRDVREQGEEYVVTVDGEPAAVVRPFTEEDARKSRRAAWKQQLAEMDALAQEITKRWPAGVSAAQAIAEDRREL